MSERTRQDEGTRFFQKMISGGGMRAHEKKVGRGLGEIMVIAVVLMGLLISPAGCKNQGKTGDSGPAGGATVTKESPGTTAAPKPEAKNIVAGKIGEPVKIANITYQVNSIDFNKVVKVPYLRKKADGIFLIMELFVKNETNDSLDLKPQERFKIKDPSGARYGLAVDATITLTLNKSSFITREVQPNIPVTGLLVFEVPDKDKEYTFEITDKKEVGNIALTAPAQAPAPAPAPAPAK